MVASRTWIFFCLFAAASASAEPLSCQLSDPANRYSVDVTIEHPPTQNFEPVAAQVILRDKSSGEVLQRIDTADAVDLVPLNDSAKALRCDEQRLVVFGDFNFDGHQDLALRDGNDGGYGAASYDVYLFKPSSPVLVPNKALSALTREPYLGLFEVDGAARHLVTHAKSGCCWRQSSTWQVKDNSPVKVTEIIEVAQRPSEGSPLMPAGYIDVTQRELKDGKWLEQRRLEGPVGEAPVMLRGKLDGKIAFELWWQMLGGVYIGEVRYTKTGNGQPIRLVGETYDDGAVLLHELDAQGRVTGDWYVAGEPDEHGFQGGTWHDGDKSLIFEARPTAFRVAPQKFQTPTGDQREGRYVMMAPDERSAWLTIKIVPATETGAGEQALIQMAVTQPGKPPREENRQWPLQAGNLVIGQDQIAEPLYRLRLLDGAVQVEGAGEFSDFRGAYAKQP